MKTFLGRILCRIGIHDSEHERNGCESCDGKGWYATGPTDRPIQVQCQFCHGTGIVPITPMAPPEEDDGAIF